MQGLSQRLLTLLQFTRMALVFTAIADSVCALLLRSGHLRDVIGGPMPWPDPRLLMAIVLVSAGLYGFGMSLNDIIDRRRDRQIAAHRPLPSGRIGLVAAHVICVLLGLTALLAGAFYAQMTPLGWLSFALVIWTGLLIAFYDFAGKYLVAPGLLTLGLIRFFHATIAAPELPLVWHPLMLLNHVTLLSTVAYVWEEKRPPLTKLHWWAVLGGLGVVDALALAVVAWRWSPDHPSFMGVMGALRVRPGLLLPFGVAVAFVLFAFLVQRRASTRREAGQKVMLYGLLWLILYDTAFVMGYVSWLAGMALLMLLPVAYLSVQLMRWWSKLVALSQRPQYQRAGHGLDKT